VDTKTTVPTADSLSSVGAEAQNASHPSRATSDRAAAQRQGRKKRRSRAWRGVSARRPDEPAAPFLDGVSVSSPAAQRAKLTPQWRQPAERSAMSLKQLGQSTGRVLSAADAAFATAGHGGGSAILGFRRHDTGR
jgi:hypothetical protein